MAPAKNPKSTNSRAWLVRDVTTPLGFYVLLLLIGEASLALVLTYSKLSEDHVWDGFLVMIGLFSLVFFTVTALVVWKPQSLLYGKDEYSSPALDPSALKDQIEDIIYSSVKPDCLQKPEKVAK
jgi:MFS superfamily sulfate permease-like transporter